MGFLIMVLLLRFYILVLPNSAVVSLPCAFSPQSLISYGFVAMMKCWGEQPLVHDVQLLVTFHCDVVIVYLCEYLKRVTPCYLACEVFDKNALPQTTLYLHLNTHCKNT